MIFTGIEKKQRKRTTLKRRQHHFTNKEIPHWYSASARDWHTPSHTPALSLSCLNLHLPFDHPLPSASTTRIFHIRSLLGRFVAVDHIQLRRWQQFCPQLFIVFDCVFFLLPVSRVWISIVVWDNTSPLNHLSDHYRFKNIENGCNVCGIVVIDIIVTRRRSHQECQHHEQHQQWSYQKAYERLYGLVKRAKTQNGTRQSKNAQLGNFQATR